MFLKHDKHKVCLKGRSLSLANKEGKVNFQLG